MKRRVLISAGVIAGVIAVITAIVVLAVQPWKFRLSDEYYGGSGFAEIDDARLKQLIDEKESFAVFVYQPACRTSDDFEKVLTEFSKKSQVKFLKIAFSKVKNSGLMGDIKYYPSAAIYHKGRLVDFLRADSDEDTGAYESIDGFQEWWRKYVK